MDFSNTEFISNIVRGSNNSFKTVKIFEYLKHSIIFTGMLFFQKTNCTKKNKW